MLHVLHVLHALQVLHVLHVLQVLQVLHLSSSRPYSNALRIPYEAATHT